MKVARYQIPQRMLFAGVIFVVADAATEEPWYLLAAIAVEAKAMFAVEAQRRLHLSKGRGKKGVELVPPVKARDQAGKLFGVSGRYVYAAERGVFADDKEFDSIIRAHGQILDGQQKN
jgi:hypothetical protein